MSGTTRTLEAKPRPRPSPTEGRPPKLGKVVLVGFKYVISGFAFLKAVVMTGVVAVLAAQEPFWHQLVLVIVSAALSAAGMVFSAALSVNRLERKVEETHRAVSDVAGAVGAAKRREDPPVPPTPH